MKESRVLVVDDEPVVRTANVAILESNGYLVKAVADGETAWKLVSSGEAPPILVVDWIMPGEIDGLELCRRIRRSIHGDSIYIVLATAKGAPKDLLAGLSAGADDFISKPFEPSELVSRIRVGERALQQDTACSPQVLEALVEARHVGDGEIVTRRGDVVGRVQFEDHKIVWAHVSTEPGSLLQIVKLDSDLTTEDEASILEECRRTSQDPTEVLLKWGLVDDAYLRKTLQIWIGRKLRIIMSLEDAEALFLPQKSSGSPRQLGFSLDELLSDRTELLSGATRAVNGSRVWQADGDHDPAISEACQGLVDEMHGGRMCAVFDDAGRLLGSAGLIPSEPPHFADRMLDLFDAAARGGRNPSGLQEVYSLTDDSAWIARRSARWLTVLEADPTTRIGAALVLIRGLDIPLLLDKLESSDQGESSSPRSLVSTKTIP